MFEEQAIADQFKQDKNQKFDEPENDLINAGNPQSAQPGSLLCPSDNARNRMYVSTSANAYGLTFGKANYVGYVSPVHVVCMRTHPGAFINETAKLSWITDGTSRTLMLTEIRTRDNQRNSRSVWAATWTGGSIIAFDMHPANPGVTGAEGGCGATPHTRNMRYIPYVYPGIDSMTPNSQPSGNTDMIHECPPNDTIRHVLRICRARETTAPGPQLPREAIIRAELTPQTATEASGGLTMKLIST